eukprot:Skav226231  [mRNA]  locus=scaffold1218:365492:372050:- [translate_table: standard]
MSQITHHTEADGAIHVVTLNLPNAQNALTMERRCWLLGDMMNEIATLFHSLRDDKKVRAVILTGSGDKAFSAGVDLLKADAGLSCTLIYGGACCSEDGIFTSYFPTPLEKDPRVQIETFPWPVICAVNGFAITGGFELALACDILIASENASFADTHSKFGIAPAWGLSQKLARMLGPSRAKELHFSGASGGRFLGAKEAAAWGLVNRVLPPNQLMPHCLDLAKEMTKMPGPPRGALGVAWDGLVGWWNPTMLRMMKQTVNDGYGMSFKDGCENEQNVAYKYYKDSAGSMLSDISDQSVWPSKLQQANANHILASKAWHRLMVHEQSSAMTASASLFKASHQMRLRIGRLTGASAFTDSALLAGAVVVCREAVGPPVTNQTPAILLSGRSHEEMGAELFEKMKAFIMSRSKGAKAKL